MVELLNQEGREQARRHDWQSMTFETTFTTVATQSQGTLATIIGATQTLRKIVNDTIWDRTAMQPICGPVSRRNWQAMQALPMSGPYSEYRIRGNALLFDPAPTAGHTCAFEYVSNCWVTDAAGTVFRRRVANDTDLVLLDEDAVLSGLEWRWLRKKGLGYAEEFSSYELVLSDLMTNDGTKPRLRMDDTTPAPRPGIMVPVGSWSLP